LEGLGAALGPGGELVVVGGNHDHGLVAGHIDARLQQEAPGFLGLETRIDPTRAGPLAAALAGRAAPATMTLAYPGVWVRDDVFATHGHYLDLHSTVPTFERLAAGAMARWISHLPAEDATPEHYEAALAPIYAFMHQLTQRSEHTVVSAGAGASRARVVAPSGNGAGRPPARARARPSPRRGGAQPHGHRGRSTATCRAPACGAAGCAASERCCAGSTSAPRTSCRPHASLRARGRATTRPSGARRPAAARQHRLVGVPAALPDGAAERVALLAGTAVLVEGDAPPRLIRLLGERSHRELAAPA
jgi:hypothetical protein